MSGAAPPGVAHVEDAFDEAFCAMLDAAREAAPVSLTSGMMLANRRFVRDGALARAVHRATPPALGVEWVSADLRFIDYDGNSGGYIRAHVDGTGVCPERGEATNASMLLYMSSTPEDDGGTTDFLETVEDEDSVVFSVRPKRGSIVVFPHDAAHVGRCVGRAAKILLRMDCRRNFAGVGDGRGDGRSAQRDQRAA
jgi:hypothetical protein